ncbi:hypothetical protein [Paraglaciecola sp. L3A3]|nr:hypothetical protein [Paraglaciecola sp. L3A3]
MQTSDDRALLPLLDETNSETVDRTLFPHRGRWAVGKSEEVKYVQYGGW